MYKYLSNLNFILVGVDIQCIGHFKLIFFLLRLDSCPRMQEMSLHVLNNVTGNAECVDDIAANNVLVNLFRPLYASLTQPSVVGGFGGHENQGTLCLTILHSLMGDTRLVKECINYSELHLFYLPSPVFILEPMQAPLLATFDSWKHCQL